MCADEVEYNFHNQLRKAYKRLSMCKWCKMIVKQKNMQYQVNFKEKQHKFSIARNGWCIFKTVLFKILNFQQISRDFIDYTTIYNYFKVRHSNQTGTKP